MLHPEPNSLADMILAQLADIQRVDIQYATRDMIADTEQTLAALGPADLVADVLTLVGPYQDTSLYTLIDRAIIDRIRPEGVSIVTAIELIR